MIFKRKKIILITVIFFIVCIQCKEAPKKYFSETVKVALRNVGHELLTLNKNLTSPVNPIKKINAFKYELSFISTLTINPTELVASIKKNFEKIELDNEYLVEIYTCKTKEVAYSYLMKQDIKEGIIPCANRTLSDSCYIIQVTFLNVTVKNNEFKINYLGYVLLISILFGSIVLIYRRKKQKRVVFNDDSLSKVIGIFSFYPEQHRLVNGINEISLSKKECELLIILVENKNQTVKRELLTRKVWEDNGVVVGRSLDTYISKLRKKLKDDTSIKITNIHGVGYKLIIS